MIKTIPVWFITLDYAAGILSAGEETVFVCGGCLGRVTGCEATDGRYSACPMARQIAAIGADQPDDRLVSIVPHDIIHAARHPPTFCSPSIFNPTIFAACSTGLDGTIILSVFLLAHCCLGESGLCVCCGGGVVWWWCRYRVLYTTKCYTGDTVFFADAASAF